MPACHVSGGWTIHGALLQTSSPTAAMPLSLRRLFPGLGSAFPRLGSVFRGLGNVLDDLVKSGLLLCQEGGLALMARSPGFSVLKIDAVCGVRNTYRPIDSADDALDGFRVLGSRNYPVTGDAAVSDLALT